MAYLATNIQFWSNRSINASVSQLVLRKFLKRDIHTSYLGICNLNTNFYDVLQIPKEAKQSQIKSAYYKLSLDFHPDKNKEDESLKKFREITEAYETLGDVNRRRRYDKGALLYSGSAFQPNKDSTIYGQTRRKATWMYVDHEDVGKNPPISSSFDKQTNSTLSSSFIKGQQNYVPVLERTRKPTNFHEFNYHGSKPRSQVTTSMFNFRHVAIATSMIVLFLLLIINGS